MHARPSCLLLGALLATLTIPAVAAEAGKLADLLVLDGNPL